jgi:hypothetical protein
MLDNVSNVQIGVGLVLMVALIELIRVWKLENERQQFKREYRKELIKQTTYTVKRVKEVVEQNNKLYSEGLHKGYRESLIRLTDTTLEKMDRVYSKLSHDIQQVKAGDAISIKREHEILKGVTKVAKKLGVSLEPKISKFKLDKNKKS